MVARSPRSWSTRPGPGPVTWPGARPLGASSSCSPFPVEVDEVQHRGEMPATDDVDGGPRRLHGPPESQAVSPRAVADVKEKCGRPDRAPRVTGGTSRKAPAPVRGCL